MCGTKKKQEFFIAFVVPLWEEKVESPCTTVRLVGSPAINLLDLVARQNQKECEVNRSLKKNQLCH